MKRFCLILLFLLAGVVIAFAEENARDQNRLYWLYEMGNSIPLSDFQLGATETIRDQDGNGFGMSWVFKKGKRINAALDFGTSRTIYQGTVQDGVTVDFVPQSGSGYEAISSSTNVDYNFDMQFENPYVGISIIGEYFLLGGGRLYQKATGDVTLSTEGVELVTAHYNTHTQLYAQGGLQAQLDWLYLGLYLRAFEAPTLEIDSCNSKAVGKLLCSRIRGAAGNRSQQATGFGEALLHVGFLF